MTMLCSIASKERIIMAADSAELIEYNSGEKEYRNCKKSYNYKGLGCVSTWGSRDHNKIHLHVGSNINQIKNIDELSDLVDKYLREEIKPKDYHLDDVGFHVGGFNQGICHLYHVFWGFDRPRRVDQTERRYGKSDHSPRDGEVSFLYNGRNELASGIITYFLDEFKRNNGSSRLDIKNPVDLIKLSDIVVRFSAEITRDVEKPFYYYIISPMNNIEVIRNDSIIPLKEAIIEEHLEKLKAQDSIPLIS